MEQIRLEPVDTVRITTVIDNSTDLTLASSEIVARPPLDAMPSTQSDTLEGSAWDGFRAEHGFSAQVQIVRGDRTSTILFDAGLTPGGVVENLDRLDIDPVNFGAIVLSHGHVDHTGGLDGIIKRLGTANAPVIIHPEFWNRRRLVIPGMEPIEMPTTSRSALEGAGFEIVENRQPSFLFDGTVLVTGEIDRTSGFEPGFPPQQAWRDGRWEPEPETLDDQALIINIRNKGLVVMSGCGHAGIVNTVRYAKRLTGVDEVHAIIGGFHLGGPMFETIIDATVRELVALAPGVIVPAHCTGWRAQQAFATHLPEAFVPNSVGSVFHL
ncbi:MAG TPA: MBL fold metallo-hydrolase [Acidimicrobiia bacterium]|nr:MBL fold metallo-hydrolase [Acidimicrobiia bacterium]